MKLSIFSCPHTSSLEVSGKHSKTSMLLKMQRSLKGDIQIKEEKHKDKILKRNLKDLSQHVQRLGQVIEDMKSEHEAAKTESDRTFLQDNIKVLTQCSADLANCVWRLQQDAKLSHQANSKDPAVLEEYDELVYIIKVAAKERLRLEHQLAQCSTTQMTEECNTLKQNLLSAEQEKQAAKEEVKLLMKRVLSLENVVRDMQESAEHVGQVEHERKTALHQLQQKQVQIEQLQQLNSCVETNHAQTLQALNKLVQELDEQRRVEGKQREELMLEVQRLQELDEQRRVEGKQRDELALEVERLQKEAGQKVEVLSESENFDQDGGGEKMEEMELTSGQSETNKDQERMQNQNDRYKRESFLESWSNNGPIQVYIAKYSYDPFSLSPNENPELELPLDVGDYVLVVGEMDEDGFFEGEQIDGTRGLVPSNFIEKVQDKDLSEFYDALLQAGHEDFSRKAHDSGNSSTHTDVSKSLPNAQPNGVDAINNNSNMSVSVCEQHHLVEDCQGPKHTPTEIKVSDISPTSACISWRPCNMSCQYSIVLNSKHEYVMKPGLVSYTMSGLIPGALQKVMLTARCVFDNWKKISSKSKENILASIEFCTPKGAKEVITSEHSESISPLHYSVETSDVEHVELPQSSFSDTSEADVSSGTVASEVIEFTSRDEEQGLDMDEEIDAAFKEFEELLDLGVDASVVDCDSSCTELSDIPEVEEEEEENEEPLHSQTSSQNDGGAKNGEPSRDKSDHKELSDQRTVQSVGEIGEESAKTETSVEIKQVIRTNDENGLENEASQTCEIFTNLNEKNHTSHNFYTSGNSLNIHDYNIVNKAHCDNSLDSLELDSLEGVFINKNHHHHHANSLFSESKTQVNGHGPKLHSPSQRPKSDSALINGYKNYLTELSSSSIQSLEDGEDISRNITPSVTANSVRLFIALFDYDPATMSPNVDSVDEELPFKERQFLKVFGNKDADGFYRGECNGRRGYVPYNMVSEVRINDSDLRKQLLQGNKEMQKQGDDKLSGSSLTPDGMVLSKSDRPTVRKMVAMYDYDPRELSPNAETELELSFKIGDVVTVYGDMDADGFYMGELDNQRGLAPSNFLQPFPSFLDLRM